MGEPIWSQIRVACPATWKGEEDDEELPWFVDRLTDILYGGDHGVEVDPERPGFAVWYVNGFGNYGHSAYEDITNWLQANRIPYELADEGKYEFSPEAEFFDGNEVWGGETGQQGGAILTSEEWRKIKAEHPDGWVEIGAAVDAHFAQFEWCVEQADISHLPDVCPSPESPVEVDFL